MWYLIYALVAIGSSTYFWSWGTERIIGWAIAATAIVAAYVGVGIEFGLPAAPGAAYCAGLACLAIGLLGRTFYDQIRNPQPVMSV